MTVSIPPKKKKNRGQQHKRGQSGNHFVALLRGKNSKGKPAFWGGFDQGPKYRDVDHALPTAHLNKLGFLLSEFSSLFRVCLRERPQLGREESLIVYERLLEGRYLH